MQKNQERTTHDRVHQRLIINLFLSHKEIHDEPDHHQRFPDCIVPTAKLCIEETSVRDYDVVDTLEKKAGQKTLELKHYGSSSSILIHRIRDAINEKQGKGSYRELPMKYETRVLLVRIDGRGLDWEKVSEKVLRQDTCSDLQPQIFNHIYLVIYPIYPTKNDIEKEIFYRPLRSDFVRIL